MLTRFRFSRVLLGRTQFSSLFHFTHPALERYLLFLLFISFSFSFFFFGKKKKLQPRYLCFSMILLLFSHFFFRFIETWARRNYHRLDALHKKTKTAYQWDDPLVFSYFHVFIVVGALNWLYVDDTHASGRSSSALRFVLLPFMLISRISIDLHLDRLPELIPMDRRHTIWFHRRLHCS